MASRITASATTINLANGAGDTVDVVGFRGYALYSIHTSAAAWVTVHTSVAARSADANRLITTDPTPGSGVVAEVISSGLGTTWFTPAVIGYSAEDPPVPTIPLRVTNNGGGTTAITVTLTLLQLEA